MLASLVTAWMPDAATLRLVLPEFVLVATLAALLIAPILLGRRTRDAGLIALVGCIVAALAAALTLPLVADHAQELFGVQRTLDEGVGPGMLAVDRLSLFFRLFIMVFLAAI